MRYERNSTPGPRHPLRRIRRSHPVSPSRTIQRQHGSLTQQEIWLRQTVLFMIPAETRPCQAQSPGSGWRSTVRNVACAACLGAHPEMSQNARRQANRGSAPSRCMPFDSIPRHSAFRGRTRQWRLPPAPPRLRPPRSARAGRATGRHPVGLRPSSASRPSHRTACEQRTCPTPVDDPNDALKADGTPPQNAAGT